MKLYCLCAVVCIFLNVVSCAYKAPAKTKEVILLLYLHLLLYLSPSSVSKLILGIFTGASCKTINRIGLLEKTTIEVPKSQCCETPQRYWDLGSGFTHPQDNPSPVK